MRRAAVPLALALAACGKAAPGPDSSHLKITSGERGQLAQFRTRDTRGVIGAGGPWEVVVTLEQVAPGAVVTVAGTVVARDAPATIDLRGSLGAGFTFPIVVDVPTGKPRIKTTTFRATEVVRAAVLADPALPFGDGDAQHADSLLWVRAGAIGEPLGVIGRGDRLDAIDLVATITETSTTRSCGSYRSQLQLGVTANGAGGIETHFDPGGAVGTVDVRVHAADVVLVDRRTGAAVARTHVVPDDATVAAACPTSVSTRGDAPVTVDALADAQLQTWLRDQLVLCTTCGPAPVRAEPSAWVDAEPMRDAFVGSTDLRGDDGKTYLAVSVQLDPPAPGTLRLGAATWPIGDDGAAYVVVDPSRLVGGAELPAPADDAAPAPALTLPVRFVVERAGAPARAFQVSTAIARGPVLDAIVAATGGLTYGADDVAPAQPRAAVLVRAGLAPALVGTPGTVAGLDLVVTVTRAKVKRSSASCAYPSRFGSSLPMQIKVVTERASLIVTARDRRTGARVATTTLAPPDAEACPPISAFTSPGERVTVEAVADDATLTAWVSGLLAP